MVIYLVCLIKLVLHDIMVLYNKNIGQTRNISDGFIVLI